jgi:hypothetical protein
LVLAVRHNHLVLRKEIPDQILFLVQSLLQVVEAVVLG